MGPAGLFSNADFAWPDATGENATNIIAASAGAHLFFEEVFMGEPF
jgi:hypothetical protein